MSKIFFALVVVVLCAIVSSDDLGMPYDFDWAVQHEESGNNFGQREQSDGEVTQGEYYVLLADGRTQTVKYTSNPESGFIANVQYDGEAQFDPAQGSLPIGAGPAGLGYRIPSPRV